MAKMNWDRVRQQNRQRQPSASALIGPVLGSRKPVGALAGRRSVQCPHSDCTYGKRSQKTKQGLQAHLAAKHGEVAEN
jgi:hypothetical protein